MNRFRSEGREVMTEWIVKDKGYVPLPPEHVLRKDVDQVCISDSQPAWISVGTSAGESVGASAYPRACCRVEDWPEELGPVPQEPCSEQEFRVEVGKRYIEARSKTVVGPLANTDPSDPDAAEYPFCDPRRRRTYTSSGRILKDHKTPGDLIAEYHEPAAEPAVSPEPQPWQWWVDASTGAILYCVGITPDGCFVMDGNSEFYELVERDDLFRMHHEPRCTGFDWRPEQPSEPAEDTRTIAELRSQCERQAGTIESLHAHIESDKRWIKSLQEQIAELTPRPPAEDPDEWVTQDRVPMRACDQRRWVNPVSMDVAVEWGRSCITSVDPAIHGAVNRVGNRLELRCRRKDLPPLPDTTPEPPKTRTIPMAVVLVSHDEVQWIEARVSMRDGKPDVPDADAKVRIVEEYTREISVGE